MNKITEEQAYNMLGLAGYSITQERKKLIVDLWKGQGFIIKDYLEEQDFYELMQTYRHCPLICISEVIEAFENVKQFIRNHSLKED